MKYVKILSLLLALLMIGCVAIACGGPAETETEAETEVETEEENKVAPLNVNIVIRASEDGEDVYVSGDKGYDYEGATLTVQDILVEFMSFEYDIEIVINDEGKLVKIGDLEASASQFWLFSIASAPKGADQAEPVDANIDEYGDIKDGDTIVVYLS